MKADKDWIRECDVSHAQSFVDGSLVAGNGVIRSFIAALFRMKVGNAASLPQGLRFVVPVSDVMTPALNAA